MGETSGMFIVYRSRHSSRNKHRTVAGGEDVNNWKFGATSVGKYLHGILLDSSFFKTTKLNTQYHEHLAVVERMIMIIVGITLNELFIEIKYLKRDRSRMWSRIHVFRSAHNHGSSMIPWLQIIILYTHTLRTRISLQMLGFQVCSKFLYTNGPPSAATHLQNPFVSNPFEFGSIFIAQGFVLGQTQTFSHFVLPSAWTKRCSKVTLPNNDTKLKRKGQR